MTALNRDSFPADEIPAIRQVMMPRDTNALGTIFGGVILSQIDLAAAIQSHEHHPGKVVTVSMDKIDFKAPVQVGDLVSFYTETRRIGRSSITVHVAVWAQRRFGGGQQVYVTDRTGPLTIVLSRAVRLTGRVVTQNGAPVQGAEVEAQFVPEGEQSVRSAPVAER